MLSCLWLTFLSHLSSPTELVEQHGNGIQVILAYAERVPPYSCQEKPVKRTSPAAVPAPPRNMRAYKSINGKCLLRMDAIAISLSLSLALLPPMFIVSHFLSFVLSTHCSSHLQCLTKSDCNMMLQTNTKVLRLSSVGELYLSIDIQRISAYANRNQFNWIRFFGCLLHFKRIRDCLRTANKANKLKNNQSVDRKRKRNKVIKVERGTLSRKKKTETSQSQG